MCVIVCVCVCSLCSHLAVMAISGRSSTAALVIRLTVQLQSCCCCSVPFYSPADYQCLPLPVSFPFDMFVSVVSWGAAVRTTVPMLTVQAISSSSIIVITSVISSPHGNYSNKASLSCQLALHCATCHLTDLSHFHSLSLSLSLILSIPFAAFSAPSQLIHHQHHSVLS